jgi:hypothetical protein
VDLVGGRFQLLFRLALESLIVTARGSEGDPSGALAHRHIGWSMNTGWTCHCQVRTLAHLDERGVRHDDRFMHQLMAATPRVTSPVIALSR